LRYKKIPFEEHLSLDVHDRIKTEVGRKIVPVVVTPDGEYIHAPVRPYGPRPLP
jgi:hypothetical protein